MDIFEKFIQNFENAEKGSVLTLHGADYNVLQELAKNGEEWAKCVCDKDLPGVNIVKIEDNSWEEYGGFCYPHHGSSKELLEFLKELDYDETSVITDKNQIYEFLSGEGYLDE